MTRPHRDERGAFTAAAVVFVAALFLLASFVSGAGRAFDTRRDVRATAAAAARAAAQGSADSLLHGQVLDTAGLDARVEAVLAAAGYTLVSTQVTGGRVWVTARGQVRTILPDPFALNGRDVTATASAELLVGVDQGVPG
jgi:hypothetical protein